MSIDDPEYPPLWPEGFHETTPDEIQERCVAGFATSETRAQLMQSFEDVLDVHYENDVRGEIWLDGSFVTEKINPKDIDFVLEIKSEFYDGGSTQLQGAVDTLIDNGPDWPPAECDTNAMFHDPPEWNTN